MLNKVWTNIQHTLEIVVGEKSYRVTEGELG